MLTIKPTLAIGSYAPRLPWPLGLRRLRVPRAAARPGHGPRHHRAARTARAQLVRAAGVLPADGKRRVVLYMHGGAFLTCGVNSHGRLVDGAVEVRRQPGAGGQLPDDPEALHRAWRSTTATTPTSGCGCAGYEPDQIVLAGDSAGGYLALALAERLQAGG